MGRHVLSVLVALWASCPALGQISQDSYGLAAQSNVYLIHHIARKTFAIERKGEGGAKWGGGLAGVARAMSAHDSARLQQKLDLEDPAIYVKASIAHALRTQAGLKNLRVFDEPSHLTVLPLARGERLVEQAEHDYQKPDPGGGAVSMAEAPPAAATFNKEYSTGAVIEVVTEYWGLDDYRIKYYASVRVVDLRESKVLLATRCTWVTLDPIDSTKLFLEARVEGVERHEQYRAYAEKAERLLYGNDGALLKATFRRAAEDCAAKVIPHLLGLSR